MNPFYHVGNFVFHRDKSLYGGLIRAQPAVIGISEYFDSNEGNLQNRKGPCTIAEWGIIQKGEKN